MIVGADPPFQAVIPAGHVMVGAVVEVLKVKHHIFASVSPAATLEKAGMVTLPVKVPSLYTLFGSRDDGRVEVLTTTTLSDFAEKRLVIFPHKYASPVPSRYFAIRYQFAVMESISALVMAETTPASGA